MNMIKTSYSLIKATVAATFFVLCLEPVQGLARGTVDGGGGGKGVLCQTSAGQAELTVLDLWEASHLHGLIEMPRQSTYGDEMNLGYTRFFDVVSTPAEKAAVKSGLASGPPSQKSTELSKQTIKNYGFFHPVHTIELGSRLPLTNDAKKTVLPENCSIVQIAIFYDQQKEIFLDLEYWNMLDQRNKVALAFHEVVYYYRRTYGAQNSDETRVFIAKLFSTTPPTPIFEGLPASGFSDCRAGIQGETPIYDFYIYPNPSGTGKIFAFRQIANLLNLSRTTSSIENSVWNEKFESLGSGGTIELSVHSETRLEERIVVFSKSKNQELQISMKSPSTGETNLPAKVRCRIL